VGGKGDMGKSLGGAMHFFGGVPPLDVVSSKLNVIIIPQLFIIITLVSATIPIARRCPILLLSKQNTHKRHCFVRLIEHIHLDENTLPTGFFSLNASSFPCWKMPTSTILSASGGALMRL
jgi:hypothetical protein